MKALSKDFYLAGVQYSDAHKLAQPALPQDCRIVHVPENPHDAFALKVFIEDVFVGHIPRTEQAAWFYHTLNNVHVKCRLLEHDPTSPKWEQFRCEFTCLPHYMTVVVNLSRYTAGSST